MNEANVGFKGTVNCLTMILQEGDEFDFILKEIEKKIHDAGKFFKNAVMYELMYPGKYHYKAKYEKFIEIALADVLKDIKSEKEE